MVEVEFLGGWRKPEQSALAVPPQSATALSLNRVKVPVADIIQSYFGLSAFMDISALGRLLGEDQVATQLLVQYDANRQSEFYAAVKSTPKLAGVGLRNSALAKFRETLAKNIDMMVSIYAVLAIVVAMGVVYNSARIQLSEQAREMASLRVLGFTRAEVGRILLLELMILVIVAQPLGWLLGYAFSWLTIQGFSSDLYRVPLIINLATYAWSSIVVVTAAIIAALIVRRRIDNLDLIAVLKTRE
jgi:putative ABC transport system permease protein